MPTVNEHLFGVMPESRLCIYGHKPMDFINRGHSSMNIATSLLEGTKAKIEVDNVIIGAVTMEELIVKFQPFWSVVDTTI